MVKVSVNLRLSFESEVEARNFHKVLSPDFRDLDIRLEGRDVEIRLQGLKPSRARALINSLLRAIQLYQSIGDLVARDLGVGPERSLE